MWSFPRIYTIIRGIYRISGAEQSPISPLKKYPQARFVKEKESD